MLDDGGFILIINDVKEETALLTSILEFMRYSVLTAEDLNEANLQLSDKTVKFIIINAKTEAFDPIVLSKKLIKVKDLTNTPIIFLGNPTDLDFYKEKLNYNNLAFLKKPIIDTELKSILNKFIENKATNFQETMTKKAYIACCSKLFSKAFAKSCKRYGVEAEVMQYEETMLEEIKSHKPDVILIQDKILSEDNRGLIDQIKNTELLLNSYLVITSTEKNGGELAKKLDADFFLPIPFLKNQVAAIFRHVLNLPKRVFFISEPSPAIIEIMEGLEELKFEVKILNDIENILPEVLDFFPDIIYCTASFPNCDPVSVASRIKDKHAFRHIKIMLEANPEETAVISRCFNVGVDEVVLSDRDSSYKIKAMTSVVSGPGYERRKNVLLVESDNALLGKVARLLKQNNYKVNPASDIFAANLALKMDKYDIMIVSYNLAYEDNWKFCVDLQSKRKSENIPLIMLCSGEENEDVKKVYNLLNISGVIDIKYDNEEILDLLKKTYEVNKSNKEKRELSKYVPKDAIKHVGDILSGVKENHVEEKFISILFSDICSFTSKCEDMEPETLVALLNSFFELMAGIINQNNGIIDKFIGDAVVARFDTGDLEADARNSSRAAYQMIAALVSWNERYEQDFQIRVGINSGKVILGNIGSTTYLQSYTFIGDNVNIAQRLESQAPPMGCYISETTRKLLGDQFEFGSVEYIKVKGKKKLVGICELYGEK